MNDKKSFEQFCEMCKKNKGLRNNQELAKYLGFTTVQGFYTMKNGKGALKDKVIRKLMDGSGVDAPIIEGTWKAQHARDEKVRRSWQSFLNKAGTAAAALPFLILAATSSILAAPYGCILC